MSNTSYSFKENSHVIVNQGGEKKVMKKILSVALSTAMAFSMFASVAFGADAKLTPEQQFNALKEAGIVSGFPDGLSHLERTLTRAELAKIIVKTLSLEPVDATSYNDKNYANHWGRPYIEAATQAGILNGKDPVKKLFDPNGAVTVQELAKVLVTALKLEVPADANNTASAWAKGYVAAAVNAGYLAEGINYQAQATRSQAVVAAYAIYEAAQVPTVKSYNVVDSKNVEFTLSNGEVVKVALEKALEPNKATEVTFKTADGKEIKASVTWVVTAAQKVVSVSANNYKELTVKFDGDLDAKTAENEDNYKVSGVTFESATYSKETGEVKLLVAEGSSALPKQKETTLEISGVKNSDASKTFSEKVKFTAVDTQLPEVTEVKALGTKAIKVVFSEPVTSSTAANLANYKIDGKAFTGNVKFTYPNIAFITTDVAVGSHQLTVQGVEDFNSFKVSPATIDFEVAEDTTAPEIVSAKAIDLTKVEIEFNEPVKSVKKAYQTSSTKTAQTPYEIKDNKVILTFSETNRLSLGESIVYLEGVTDYSNNSADRNTTVTPELDTVRPEVTSVTAESKDSPARTLITVEFSESVNADDIAKADNYVLRNEKGEIFSGKGFTTKGHPVKTPVYAKDKNSKDILNKVVLESIDTLPAGKYSLEIAGIRDRASIGNTLVPVKVEFSVTETGSVKVNSAWYTTDGDDTLVYIQFNKALASSGSGDATVVSKYNYVDAAGTHYPFPGKSAKAELYSADTVRIVVPTADLTNWSNVASVRATNIADVNDNYLVDQSVAISNISSSFVDIKAADVKATDRKTIQVKTDGPISYVDKNDFVFTGLTTSTYGVDVALKDNNTVIEFTFDKEVLPYNSGVTVSTVDKGLIKSSDSYGRKLKEFSAVTVKDEIKPELDTTNKPVAQNDKVTLTFTENVKQYFTPKAFKVFVNGNSVDAIAASASGKQIVITLADVIPTEATVEVYLEGNESGKFVTDLAGNPAADFFTGQIVAGATTEAPDLDVEVAAGKDTGSTSAKAEVGTDNSLVYVVSKTKPSTPNVGSAVTGTAYKSGDDIKATADQYLAIYEVDANGKVVRFYSKQLIADDIQA
ncbi:S-layer homology domain-containing protein [Paenibacillus sp. oral taxon 786]|uniref:S-layer homology domain-containing protein n=1 Tax=Paenibacillus sp. oral taxon 786 TaxID=652715 RepID=UPI0002F0040D|nr:S-layer homology domain-containing protein [Paenibacillus sp. oral taxon 786]